MKAECNVWFLVNLRTPEGGCGKHEAVLVTKCSYMMAKPYEIKHLYIYRILNRCNWAISALSDRNTVVIILICF